MSFQPFSPGSFQTFGDLLKYLRRRERLTQLELSIAVGYSEAQIGRLEKNQRRPDITALKALFIPALHIENEPEFIARFLELAQSARQEDAPAPGIPPYRGLLFFDESDAELFFGREILTAHIADRVTDLVMDSNSRFLTVVGASGSGKSSLMRAGLAVALKQAGWDVCIFTPGANPLRAIAMLLEENQAKAESDPLLILVDQFEEIFTLCHQESERVSFIEKLLDLASEPSKKISVVIALRADFYSHCAQYPALRQAVAGEQEYIGQMTLDELRRAIEEPARQNGWEFEHGLVDVLLSDIGAQGTSQPEPGALPLLSHALLATWERRRGRTMTLDGYRASGGVRGAIAETAESLFTDQLNQTQQEMARDVFLRLTELGEGTEDTRRRAALNELVRQPGEATHLRAVLNMLAEARLITLNEDSAEVAHEALIREWQRLHEWLTQDREGLLLHRHLTESARGWEIRGHDPSELYRGARLAQAREWASVNEGRLNPSEQSFLAASIEQEEHDALERETQRQRELETAYKLAETQIQAAKQLRRRAAFLTGAFVLSILLVGISIYYGIQAKNNGLKAQSRELAAAAIINLDTDPERSILLSLQAVFATDTLEAQNALHRSILTSRVRKVIHDDSEVWSVAYSPDGTRIATASWDNTAQVWDSDSGQRLLILIGHSESVNGIAYTPDGKLLATASDDGTAIIWDAETGKELHTLSGHEGAVHDISFSPDGHYLATASDDGTAKIWNVKTGEEKLTFSGHGDTVFDVAFSPDGNQVATSGLDEYVRIWDATTGKELLALPFEGSDQLRGLAFSPDGTNIAVTSTRFPWGRVWDAATGEVVLNGFPGHRDALVDIAYRADGKLIATASSDATAKIWDADSGELLYTLSGHTLPVTGLAFNPAGTHLATTSWDQTIRVWSITPVGEALFIPINPPWSLRVSYSPDGTRILADVPEEKSAIIWDATSGDQLLNLNEKNAQISLTTYSPDGKLIAAVDDKNIIIWDSDTGKQKFTLSAHTAPITSLSFSSDGTRLISGSANGELIIWDVINGKQALMLQGPTEGFTPIVHYEIFAVAYSPDNKHILSGDTYGQAIIWDENTGQKMATHIYEEAVGNHSFPDIGFDAAFSPDGKHVAITGGLGTTRIWDASTGEDVLTLRDQTGAVGSVTFSSDGKLIATGSVDGTAMVWDAVTGANLLTLPVDSRGVGGISFSPSGDRLVVGGVSGIYVFVLPIEEVVELARSRLTRSLTDAECQQYLHVPVCPDGL
jgi:WD40 repeat protein/transcriptional regulator with XRE-family HTH domain